MDDAVDEYRKALLFLPDETDYRLALATTLLRTGRLDEAEAHLEQMLEDDPTNGRINLALARIAAQRRDLKSASDYYQRAVYEYWPPEQIPQRREARWELIGVLEKTGRRNEVVGELLQLSASAPPGSPERARIAFDLLNHNAVSEAARIFRTLERERPDYEESHRGLAQVYFAMGNYVSARHEFQHALRIDPHDRTAADALTLTNSVIEMDPALPGISSAERLRRSKNVLSRVLSDLDPCLTAKPAGDVVVQQLDTARKLLTAKHAANDDLNLQFQRTALQIWRERNSWCGEAPSDRAVDLALNGIADE